jgi:bis(5'-nucleosyl)-tetraphosphatase (symmetrical)
MHFLVGDLQGCLAPLEQLLGELDFSPSRDHLHVLGDLVNRGPDSLGVLRRLRGLGASASCLLGNHDLHLLAVAAGVRKPHWDATQTLALAAEVEQLLRSEDLHDFLQVMYGNQPDRWSDELQGADRWRFIINTLTRVRFCSADGQLEFRSKDGADSAPPGFAPWFSHPLRRSAVQPIAFGHWSTLGLINSPQLLALDTGCLWGGTLTAVRVDGGRREVVQIACPQAQVPQA